MRKIQILSVCGSGTVSSSMLSMKLKDLLDEFDYSCNTTEVSSSDIKNALVGKHYDFIACVSPVEGDFGIPKIDSVGFLTGLGEEECIKEVLEVIKGLDFN